MKNWRVNIKKCSTLMPPDFLCIGAQKSGTTWLYKNLEMIPDFEMPPHKELHYFNNIGAKGLTIIDLKKYKTRLLLKRRIKYHWTQRSVNKLKWDIKYIFNKRTEDWYISLFKRPTGKIAGDISPAYSTLDEQAVRYISKILPEIKVLLILRNPIDRAWSHAKMDFVRFHKKKIKDITNREFIEHFDSEASRLRGDYLRTINIWSQNFTTKRFYISFFDDIVNRPNIFLKNILSFLGVDPDHVKYSDKIEKVINKSADGEMPLLIRQYLTKKYTPAINELHKLFGSRVYLW